MTILKLKDKHIEFQKLDKIIRENVPVGGNIRKINHSFSSKIELEKLRCFKYINESRAQKSIGTLGGGNNFIEVDKDSEMNFYIVIHSVCVNERTLDEAPFAYRKIDDILEVLDQTVEVNKIINQYIIIKRGNSNEENNEYRYFRDIS